MTLAVSTYGSFLVVHIVAATVWLGGGLMLNLLGARIAKQGDPARLVAFAKDVEAIGNRVFVPSALLVLIFGFLLIWEGPWGFDQLWIQLALGMFVFTFLTGALFLGPTSGKIARLVGELGVEAPAVQRQIRQVLFVSRLDLLTLYSLLVVMVAKPEADDGLLFTLWGVVLAVAVVWLVAAHRREQ